MASPDVWKKQVLVSLWVTVKVQRKFFSRSTTSIQLNKGRFNAGYNLSVESSVLLLLMRDAGSKEFNIGVMSDDEVLDLFN